MKKQHARNIPFTAALVLLCLALLSASLSSGLFARYVSRGAGEDAARTAKWSVSLSPAKVNETWKNEFQDKTFTYDLTFTTANEVSAKADVDVVFDLARLLKDKAYLNADKAKLDLWIKNVKVGTAVASSATKYEDGKYIVSVPAVAVISPGEESVTKSLSVTVAREFWEALEGDGYQGTSISVDPDNKVWYQGVSGYTKHGLDDKNDVISIEDGEIPFTVQALFTQID